MPLHGTRLSRSHAWLAATVAKTDQEVLKAALKRVETRCVAVVGCVFSGHRAPMVGRVRSAIFVTIFDPPKPFLAPLTWDFVVTNQWSLATERLPRTPNPSFGGSIDRPSPQLKVRPPRMCVSGVSPTSLPCTLDNLLVGCLTGAHRCTHRDTAAHPGRTSG